MTKQDFMAILDNAINEHSQSLVQQSNPLIFVQTEARLAMLRDVKALAEKLDEPKVETKKESK